MPLLLLDVVSVHVKCLFLLYSCCFYRVLIKHHQFSVPHFYDVRNKSYLHYSLFLPITKTQIIIGKFSSDNCRYYLQHSKIIIVRTNCNPYIFKYFIRRLFLSTVYSYIFLIFLSVVFKHFNFHFFFEYLLSFLSF